MRRFCFEGVFVEVHEKIFRFFIRIFIILFLFISEENLTFGEALSVEELIEGLKSVQVERRERALARLRKILTSFTSDDSAWSSRSSLPRVKLKILNELKKLKPREFSGLLPYVILNLNSKFYRVSDAALEVLRKAGQLGLSPLLSLLSKGNRKQRVAAAIGLSKLKLPPSTAGPLLSSLSRERAPELVSHLLLALSNIQPSSDRIVRAIGSKFYSKNSYLREVSVKALGNIKGPYRLKYYYLIRALRDKNLDIIYSAGDILLEEPPSSPRAIRELIKIYFLDISIDDSTRWEYVDKILVKIGEPALPFIVSLLLRSKNKYRRIRGIEVIDAMGPKARSVIPELLLAIKKKKYRVTLVMTPKCRGGKPRIVHRIEDNEEVVLSVESAVLSIGKAGLPYLKRALKSKDLEIRKFAAKLIKMIKRREK